MGGGGVVDHFPPGARQGTLMKSFHSASVSVHKDKQFELNYEAELSHDTLINSEQQCLNYHYNIQFSKRAGTSLSVRITA